MRQHLRAVFSFRGETRLEPGLRSIWNFFEDSLEIPLNSLEILAERDVVIAVAAERLDQAGIGDRGRPALDGYGARVDENVSGPRRGWL